MYAFASSTPSDIYVLDFYCAAARLAIEVDGFAHETGDRPQRDETRSEWLRSQGIEVLRIPAKDVLADPDSVADGLLRLCANRSTTRPRRAVPLPAPAAQGGAHERQLNAQADRHCDRRQRDARHIVRDDPDRLVRGGKSATCCASSGPGHSQPRADMGPGGAILGLLRSTSLLMAIMATGLIAVRPPAPATARNALPHRHCLRGHHAISS